MAKSIDFTADQIGKKAGKSLFLRELGEKIAKNAKSG